MKLIMDESSSDLTGLLSTIKTMAPEIWRSSDRRHLLPEKLEDLDKPEFLDEIRAKITKIRMLKEKLDCGRISQAEYATCKARILLRS
ncbi:MAG TPA: hypothetical protein PLJ25_06545 [Methanothrix sp.]|nr:hypothetical protein [Methanothrix sp.]